ncbi:hypothetical protein HDU89_002111 [Geranomyces variabilis]|nr:hypothetical protein HDU89_002111 [Geranomyces variabilis]
MPLPSRREGVLQLICLLWVLSTLSLTAASPAAQSPAFFPRNVNHTSKAASDDNRELAFGHSAADGATRPGLCGPLNMSYTGASTALELQKNGHSMQVDINGASQMTFSIFSGEVFDLQQLQFRVVSEQLLEILMVHKSASGRIAIVVLRIDIDQRGATQSKTSFLSSLTAALGAIQSSNTATVVETFTLASLLPVLSASSNWIYIGSPTTSPCSESVLWFTLSTSVQISIVEFVEFREVIGHHDADAGDLVMGGITVVEMEPAATSLQMNNLVAGGIAVVELNPAAASGSQTVQPPSSSSRWFFPTDGLPFLRHG